MEELSGYLTYHVFDTPLYFWISGFLVLLIIFFPWFKKRKGLAINLQYWKGKVVFKSNRIWTLSIPIIIASVLIAGALSSPQIIKKPIITIYGYPVVLVLDISASMGIGYSALTSFVEASEAYQYAIAQRGDINLGLILFSTENYVARFFINKDELLQDAINLNEIAYLSKGTRIAEALIKARQFIIESASGNDKAIILISDMDADTGEGQRIAEEKAQISLAGIKLFIVATGVGRTQASVYAIVDQIFEDINSMQMSPIRQEEGNPIIKSMVPLFILPVLGIIVFCMILSETCLRKIP